MFTYDHIDETVEKNRMRRLISSAFEDFFQRGGVITRLTRMTTEEMEAMRKKNSFYGRGGKKAPPLKLWEGA